MIKISWKQNVLTFYWYFNLNFFFYLYIYIYSLFLILAIIYVIPTTNMAKMHMNNAYILYAGLGINKINSLTIIQKIINWMIIMIYNMINFVTSLMWTLKMEWPCLDEFHWKIFYVLKKNKVYFWQCISERIYYTHPYTTEAMAKLY